MSKEIKFANGSKIKIIPGVGHRGKSANDLILIDENKKEVCNMKVKDFINKLNEIGYNDETEIVFNLKNENEDTYKDFYCQSIYAIMPFTYNTIGIDIDKKYK